jgi:hypothetical protein
MKNNRKNKIISIFIGLSVILSSCTGENKIDYRKSSKIPLRQMISDKETNASSSAWFFILGGSYSSHSEENNYVKCLAKADGCYYFLKMNLQKVRIQINNKVKNPYIIIDYSDFKLSNEDLIVHSYHVDFYTIVCPEKYLPKNLTPIKI